MAASSMTPCAHPEESVECFYDTSDLATEHAEWCSICGAYRVVCGGDDKPWTLPKADYAELKRCYEAWISEAHKRQERIAQLERALKKFGRHPTGDMEGVGRCAGFRLAAPFREELCDCGLNAALAGPLNIPPEYQHVVYGTASALVREKDGSIREATPEEAQQIASQRAQAQQTIEIEIPDRD